MGAGQPPLSGSGVNKNVHDLAEKLGKDDPITQTVCSVTQCDTTGLTECDTTGLTECDTTGLTPEESTDSKLKEFSQLGGHTGCKPREAAEVSDAPKNEGIEKNENVDQSDAETEEDTLTSKSELMEASDEQAQQSDALQIVSHTPNTGESDGLHSDPKPVSLNYCDDPQNVFDNMKTLNDLDLSPDYFTYDQPSQQSPSKDFSAVSASDAKLYPSECETPRNKEDKQCKTSEPVDVEQEMHVPRGQNPSQSQMRKDYEGDITRLGPEEWNGGGSTTQPSLSSNKRSPPGLEGTELATLSPPSFLAAGQSPLPSTDSWESMHHPRATVGHSLNPQDPRDQIHLPACYKRAAAPVCGTESMRSKVPRRADSYSLEQQNLPPYPRNTPDDGDLEPDRQPLDGCSRPSAPLPVHRICQTVSEILGGMERNVQVLRSDSFRRDDFEGPASVFGQKRTGGDELHAGRLEEPDEHRGEEGLCDGHIFVTRSDKRVTKSPGRSRDYLRKSPIGYFFFFFFFLHIYEFIVFDLFTL